MDWWPNAEYGLWSWLQVLPAFFAPAVPIMFLIDWYVIPPNRRLRSAKNKIISSSLTRINRPFVEEAVENVLRRIDLLNIEAHYARSPASGFWILEHAGKLIGLIAIDASADAASDERATEQTTERLKAQLGQKGTARVATIRHFFAEEAFRRVAIEDDMLQFAVKSTFGADRAVDSIRMLASPLRPAILGSLRRNNFAKGDRVGVIGLLRWEICWYTLERTRWQAAKET